MSSPTVNIGFTGLKALLRFKRLGKGKQLTPLELAQREYEAKLATLKDVKPHILWHRLRLSFTKDKNARNHAENIQMCVLLHILCKFFSQQTFEVKFYLSRYIELDVFKTGTIICKEGEVGTRYYIVLSGLINIVVKNPEGAYVVVSNMKNGAAFGDMALISNQPRSAACIAQISPTEILSVDKDTFMKIYKKMSMFNTGSVKFIKTIPVFRHVEYR
ncbi:hypothetical protein CYMTET_43642 [Cymbomonas tetramitiformis]|uniref:Cyclic nucleotide-binding domain-containing protein n=1 Tax=Cymbomonas tetramitiformis TaxID=36881 RepID=A0AAE0C2V6_9CHLO|nr:hypothetical protein CYMTET_43642 [Cymbomonas tetramitiformis]